MGVRFAALALTLAGCATPTAQIQAQYVSAAPYQPLTCDQLSEEAARIHGRLGLIGGAQDQRAGSDTVAAVAAPVMPAATLALLALPYGSSHADEIGRLKGEQAAVLAVWNEKGCSPAPYAWDPVAQRFAKPD